MLRQQINTAATRKPDPMGKPQLENYGLSQEMKDRLEKLQARICLAIWIITALITYLLLIFYWIGYFGATPRPYNSRLFAELVFCTFLFLLFGLMTIGILSYAVTRLYLRLTTQPGECCFVMKKTLTSINTMYPIMKIGLKVLTRRLKID